MLKYKKRETVDIYFILSTKYRTKKQKHKRNATSSLATLEI